MARPLQPIVTMNALLIAFLAVQSLANPTDLEGANATADAMLAAGCTTTMLDGASEDSVSVTCDQVASWVYTDADAAEEDAPDACDTPAAIVVEFDGVYVAICE